MVDLVFMPPEGLTSIISSLSLFAFINEDKDFLDNAWSSLQSLSGFPSADVTLHDMLGYQNILLGRKRKNQMAHDEIIGSKMAAMARIQGSNSFQKQSLGDHWR